MESHIITLFQIFKQFFLSKTVLLKTKIPGSFAFGSLLFHKQTGNNNVITNGWSNKQFAKHVASRLRCIVVHQSKISVTFLTVL